MAFKETIMHVASGKESLKGECEGLKTMHVAAGKDGKQYVAAFQM